MPVLPKHEMEELLNQGMDYVYIHKMDKLFDH
jgi:hypothetical protein